MSLQHVINCAPFRLPQPRNLTPFEWTVVEGAVASGFETAGVFAMGPARSQVVALVSAIGAQNGCPEWKTSMFGPAPAVAPYAYECIGAWFARLDPASQSRALYDIAYRGLLCGKGLPPGYTAYSCPQVSAQIGRGQRDQWEGAAQSGMIAPGVRVEPCAYVRDRIVYTPMTGQEMLELFKSVGGQLPPQMQQAAQFASFIKRSFLVGIMLKKGMAASQLPATGDMMAMAKGVVEEMAIIWAPGKGASLLFLLDGADPNKLMQLLTAMAPDLLQDIIPNLPNLLPGLIPPPGDPFWSVIFGSGQQLVPSQLAGAGFGQATLQHYRRWPTRRLVSGSRIRSAADDPLGLGDDIPQPGTPPTTGVDVIDTPGEQLPDEKPPIGGLKVGGFTLHTWAFVGAAALLVTAVAVRVFSPD